MAWKTIREVKDCKKCGGLVFKKVLTEKVRISEVMNYNKEGKSTGGCWDEGQEGEHTVTYHCVKCMTELK